VRPFTYQISVKRDVPRVLPFAIAFIVLIIPPIFAWIRAYSFEQTRWQESDHAPVSSGDDDDDE